MFLLSWGSSTDQCEDKLPKRSVFYFLMLRTQQRGFLHPNPFQVRHHVLRPVQLFPT